MSTRSKMIHITTGKIVRVNLHPSKARIFQSNGYDCFANRLKEMTRKGFRLLCREQIGKTGFNFSL